MEHENPDLLRIFSSLFSLQFDLIKKIVLYPIEKVLQRGRMDGHSLLSILIVKL